VQNDNFNCAWVQLTNPAALMLSAGIMEWLDTSAFCAIDVRCCIAIVRLGLECPPCGTYMEVHRLYQLYAYCDSDYAQCPETRRSVTGLVVKCGVGFIRSQSAKQPTVSRSTAEAEYVAAGEVVKEVQNIHALALGMKLDPGCIPIGLDNRAALFLIEDPVSAARTKHIEVVIIM
jgi:hypothetical protein